MSKTYPLFSYECFDCAHDWLSDEIFPPCPVCGGGTTFKVPKKRIVNGEERLEKIEQMERSLESLK